MKLLHKYSAAVLGIIVFNLPIHAEITHDIVQLKILADQGVAGAQSQLGYYYQTGQGVPEDDAEAVNWYRKAADQRDAIAQSNLAVCYHIGDGVPKDDAEAVKWYRKAADQGFDNAQYELGLCYAKGEGVPKDEIEAYAYFNLAGIRLQKAREVRDSLEKIMSSSQRDAAHRRTKELQAQIAAKAGEK